MEPAPRSQRRPPERFEVVPEDGIQPFPDALLPAGLPARPPHRVTPFCRAQASSRTGRGAPGCSARPSCSRATTPEVDGLRGRPAPTPAPRTWFIVTAAQKQSCSRGRLDATIAEPPALTPVAPARLTSCPLRTRGARRQPAGTYASAVSQTRLDQSSACTDRLKHTRGFRRPQTSGSSAPHRSGGSRPTRDSVWTSPRCAGNWRRTPPLATCHVWSLVRQVGLIRPRTPGHDLREGPQLNSGRRLVSDIVEP
jgi:hypothetical protein